MNDLKEGFYHMYSDAEKDKEISTSEKVAMLKASIAAMDEANFRLAHSTSVKTVTYLDKIAKDYNRKRSEAKTIGAVMAAHEFIESVLGSMEITLTDI